MAKWKMFVNDGPAKPKVNCNTGRQKYCNLMELQPEVLSVGAVIARSLYTQSTGRVEAVASI